MFEVEIAVSLPAKFAGFFGDLIEKGFAKDASQVIGKRTNIAMETLSEGVSPAS